MYNTTDLNKTFNHTYPIRIICFLLWKLIKKINCISLKIFHENIFYLIESLPLPSKSCKIEVSARRSWHKAGRNLVFSISQLLWIIVVPKRQPRLTVFFSKQESPNLTLMYTVINDVLFRLFNEFNDSIYL